MSRPTRERKPAPVFGSYVSSDRMYGSDDEGEDEINADGDDDDDVEGDDEYGVEVEEAESEVEEVDSEKEEEGSEYEEEEEEKTSKKSRKSSTSAKDTQRKSTATKENKSDSKAKPKPRSKPASSTAATNKGKKGKDDKEVQKEVKKIELKSGPIKKKSKKIVESDIETEVPSDHEQEIEDHEEHDEGEGSDGDEGDAKKLVKKEQPKKMATTGIVRKRVGKIESPGASDEEAVSKAEDDINDEGIATDTDEPRMTSKKSSSTTTKAASTKKVKPPIPLLKPAVTMKSTNTKLPAPKVPKNKIHLAPSSGSSVTSGVKPTAKASTAAKKGNGKFTPLLPKSFSIAPSSASSSFTTPSAIVAKKAQNASTKKIKEGKEEKSDDKEEKTVKKSTKGKVEKVNIKEDKASVKATIKPKVEVKKGKPQGNSTKKEGPAEDAEDEMVSGDEETERLSLDPGSSDEAGESGSIAQNISDLESSKVERRAGNSSSGRRDEADQAETPEKKSKSNSSKGQGKAAAQEEASDKNIKRKISETQLPEEDESGEDEKKDSGEAFGSKVEEDASGDDQERASQHGGSEAGSSQLSASSKRKGSGGKKVVKAGYAAPRRSDELKKKSSSKEKDVPKQAEDDAEMDVDEDQPFSPAKEESSNIQLVAYPTPVTPPKRKEVSSPSTPCPSPKRTPSATKIPSSVRGSIISYLLDSKFTKTLAFTSIETPTYNSTKLARHWREVLAPELQKHFEGKSPKKGKASIDKGLRIKIWELVTKNYEKVDWKSIEEENQEFTTTKLKRHFREAMVKEGKKYIESC
ncbi:hypothetical protein I203_101706 [Kwoniella mangroviensis CBS 8507]|uniref:uncharacterized protein n=1 Tax=Kwoniella mangroviensis CBS 8507 TaxID=1296122 RepID=UPI00080D6D40|nr:uncharacterized protein I203_07272 [Kwoniella mangroviensis CBS 8507]OCF63574.1 hypothetical protein I203_07272 [Kwoniella mangroviensis CBS 8507]